MPKLPISVLSIIIEAGLWTWAFYTIAAHPIDEAQTANGPLVLLIIGSMLVTGGVGALAYNMGIRSRNSIKQSKIPKPNKKSPNETEHNRSDPVLDIVRSVRSLPAISGRFAIPKTFLIIFAQGIILILLYSWMVQEYRANTNMQTWLGPNVSLGNALFSFNSLLVLIGVIALLLYESLPGKILSR